MPALASDVEKNQTQRVSSSNSENKNSDITIFVLFHCRSIDPFCHADLKISMDLFIFILLLMYWTHQCQTAWCYTKGTAWQIPLRRKIRVKTIIYPNRYSGTDGKRKISHILCQFCFPFKQTAKISFLSCRLVAWTIRRNRLWLQLTRLSANPILASCRILSNFFPLLYLSRLSSAQP